MPVQPVGEAILAADDKLKAASAFGGHVSGRELCNSGYVPAGLCFGPEKVGANEEVAGVVGEQQRNTSLAMADTLNKGPLACLPPSLTRFVRVATMFLEEFSEREIHLQSLSSVFRLFEKRFEEFNPR